MAESEEQRKLARAALAATAPNPKTWVQIVQMTLAVLALAGALSIAGILILHGPPSPKAATGEVTQTTKTTSAGKTAVVETTREGVVGPSLTTESGGEEGGAGSGSGGEESSNEASGTSESAGEGESLANLSKQGPWAFAIVALLAAVFLATGKTLNVGGSNE